MVDQEVVESDEFDRRGRTVNGRFEFLASSVQQWTEQGKLSDPLLLLAWNAELARWRSWFAANIVNTPFFPLQSTWQIDGFDQSVRDWRTKLEQAAHASAPAPSWTPAEGKGGVGEAASKVASAVVTIAVVVALAVVASKVVGDRR